MSSLPFQIVRFLGHWTQDATGNLLDWFRTDMNQSTTMDRIKEEAEERKTRIGGKGEEMARLTLEHQHHWMTCWLDCLKRWNLRQSDSKNRLRRTPSSASLMTSPACRQIPWQTCWWWWNFFWLIGLFDPKLLMANVAAPPSHPNIPGMPSVLEIKASSML